MKNLSRRQFIKGSIAAMATITVAGTKSSGQVRGANETIRVAVAGLNGRGGSHVSAYNGMQGVQITHLVDPDTRTFARRLNGLRGPAPRGRWKTTFEKITESVANDRRLEWEWQSPDMPAELKAGTEITPPKPQPQSPAASYAAAA